MMKLGVVLLTNCHTEIQILVHNTNAVISNKEPIDALLNSIMRKYHERQSEKMNCFILFPVENSASYNLKERVQTQYQQELQQAPGPSSTHPPFSRMFWTMCKGGNENTLHHGCNLQLSSWVTWMNQDASFHVM